ncbi:uncharacterized protein VICG_02205, partial [Vittaforma corneae ATCC 50505]
SLCLDRIYFEESLGCLMVWGAVHSAVMSHVSICFFVESSPKE